MTTTKAAHTVGRSLGPAVSGDGFTRGCGGFATIIVGKKRVKAADAATAILSYPRLHKAVEKYLIARAHYEAVAAPGGRRFDVLCDALAELRAAAEARSNG